MDQRDEDLTESVEESVEALVKLHRDHHQGASGPQRWIDGTTGLLSQPLGLALIVGGVVLWVGSNLILGLAMDAPSYFWLELGATVTALLLAVLILVTQRREDQLAEQRAQLTLELALLNDRKSSKIVSLLEELRRDMPSVANRPDKESEAMGEPTDPDAVLSVIKDRTEQAKHTKA